MLLIDPADGAVLDANAAACRFYGWSREELTSKTVADINTMSPDEISTEMARVAALATSRLHFRHRLANGEERFVEVHSGPIEMDGRQLLCSIIIDETPRIEAELALTRRERLFGMLAEINQCLIRARERESLFLELCRVAVESGGFRFSWVGLVDAAGQVVPVAQAGEDDGYIGAVRATVHPGDPRSAGPAGRCITTGLPVVSDDFLADPANAPWRDHAATAQVTSVASIPLREEGKTIGAILLYASERGFFAEWELATLTDMAVDVSYGLDMLVSTRRRLDAETQAAEWSHRLEGYLEHSPTVSYAIAVTPAGRQPEWVSTNAVRLLWASVAEMMEPVWWTSHLHPDDCAAATAGMAAIVTNGSTRLEYRFRTADGRVIWVLDTARYTPNASGVGGRIIGTWTDVTERHEALEEIRVSEERLRLALSAASQGLYDLDLRSGEAHVTPEYATMLGYDPASFRETNAAWRERMHPDDLQPVSAVFEAYVSGKLSDYRVEHRQRTREGEWRWILSVGRIVARDAQGNPLRMLGTHTDITDIKYTEAALRLRSSALEAAADAIVITDPAGIVEWANPAFTALTGYSLTDTAGRNPRQLLRSGVQSSEFYTHMWQTILSGQVWRGELINRRMDGTHYPESLTITPVFDPAGAIGHFIAIKRDLTEDHSLRENLLQAQKMESVGRLAGGVAHDFNNLLTVINGSIEIALGHVSTESPAHEDLVEIRNAAQRAGALTRQLLAFSRRQILRRHLVDVPQLILDLSKMLRRLIGEDVLLITDLPPSAARVLADSGQLEQVVMNLAVNARDAMPNGGTLTLSTAEVELSARETIRNSEMHPGRYLRLSVRDTGSGMDSQVSARIFEPFFTTKSAGQGTGLGLSTVYGIVQQSGGDVTVESTVGVGSVFHVFLPIADSEIDESSVELPPYAAISADASAGRLTGTVLVVDDEPVLRSIAAKILSRSGFTALSAGNAEEAVAVFEAHGGKIDLLLTDVVMPGMSGPQLASELTARKPGLKVVFTSGYTDDTVFRHGVDGMTMDFLSKPYTFQELVARVETTMRS